MRLAEDFFFGVAGDFQKYVVCVSDVTTKVSFADDDFFGIEETFVSSWGESNGAFAVSDHCSHVSS